MGEIRQHGASLALAAVVLACATMPAAGEPAVGSGVGTYSCAEFTRAAAGDESREMLYFSWAQGWMTAWDLEEMSAGKLARDLSQPPVPTQRAFLVTWCSTHPTELYMKGVYQLYETLKPIKK